MKPVSPKRIFMMSTAERHEGGGEESGRHRGEPINPRRTEEDNEEEEEEEREEVVVPQIRLPYSPTREERRCIYIYI